MPKILETITTSQRKASSTRLLIFILAVTGLFILARVFDLQNYIQEDHLRRFIVACGLWGPVIYLLFWAIVPILLLPCLPLTLAGGVLFGPFWGVVYATIGSATGASLAFLVARYLARDWVAAKLSGTRLGRLDDQVARNGWKIVAFSRIIPVAPYFLLNYAFGLTQISLLPYVIATLIAMLPWTIAFVLVSSSILPFLQGQVSIWLVIGAILVALVSLLPLLYKRVKVRQGESLEI
jgi:uncharacterized membrane protein YdjX (TVP38/TMEM64 family)